MKFSKDRLFDTAGKLGRVAGKSYEAFWDKTLDVAKTTDRAIGTFMHEFQNASQAKHSLHRERAQLPAVAADVALPLPCKWRGCRSDEIPSQGYCGSHLFEYGKFVQRHCGKKIKYETILAALPHLRDLENKQQSGLSVYRCEVCSNFHVGHRKDKAGLDMSDGY